VLHAKAKAESARVKMNPPWQMPCPFVMSGRIVIERTASPGETRSTAMPSPWLA
jgi:hypothetical protein